MEEVAHSWDNGRFVRLNRRGLTTFDQRRSLMLDLPFLLPRLDLNIMARQIGFEVMLNEK